MKGNLLILILLLTGLSGTTAEASTSLKKSGRCNSFLSLLDVPLIQTLDQLASLIQEQYQADAASPMAVKAEEILREKFLQLENLLPTEEIRDATKKYLAKKVRDFEKVSSRTQSREAVKEAQSRALEDQLLRQYKFDGISLAEDGEFVDTNEDGSLIQLRIAIKNNNGAKYIFSASNPTYHRLVIRKNIGTPKSIRYIAGTGSTYITTDLGIIAINLKELPPEGPLDSHLHWVMKFNQKTIDSLIDSLQERHGETRDRKWFSDIFLTNIISDDGNIIAAKWAWFIIVYNVANKSFLSIQIPGTDSLGLSSHFALSPNGQYVTNGTLIDRNPIALMDTSTGAILDLLKYNTEVSAFSHDSKWLLVRGNNSRLLMKNIGGTAPDKVFKSVPRRSSGDQEDLLQEEMFFSPDDKKAFARIQGGLGVWDVATGIFLQKITINANMDRFSFSKDGRSLYGFLDVHPVTKILTWKID